MWGSQLPFPGGFLSVAERPGYPDNEVHSSRSSPGLKTASDLAIPTREQMLFFARIEFLSALLCIMCLEL